MYTQEQLDKLNGRKTSIVHLTPRELEVCALVAKFYNNQEIADHLYISKFTVSRHVKNVYYKLGITGSPLQMRMRLIDRYRQAEWYLTHR